MEIIDSPKVAWKKFIVSAMAGPIAIRGNIEKGDIQKK